MNKQEQKKFLYPCFEIIETVCYCGKQKPLYAYDVNFLSYLDKFKNKYNLSEKTTKNIFIKRDPDLLMPCCMNGLRFGKVFPISVEIPEKNCQETTKQITHLPGPLSNSNALTWL